VKLLAGVAVLLLLPSAALAQGNPGPFGGLFGRSPERVGGDYTAVDLRNSLAGQFDDAVLVDRAMAPEDVPPSGYTAGANTSLAFETQSDRLTFRALGGATYQEFYRSPTFGATTYNGSLLTRARLTTRLFAEADALYSRSPFFSLVPAFDLGSPVIVPGSSSHVLMRQTENYAISGSLSSRYSKSSTLTVGGSRRRSTVESDGAIELDVVGVQARCARQMSRGFGIHAAYGREEISNSLLAGERFLYELIDIGVDLNHQLSFSRRTTFTLTTGTAMVKRPITGRRYRLNGAATLSTEFRRTWRASLGASRNTEFLPGFLEPLFSDSATASVNGMLATRVEFSTTLAAGVGRFGDEGSRFETWTTTSRLNWAFTRYLGMFTQYALYYADALPTVGAIALPGQVSRQSITVGFNTWIPIVNKVRAPRDPE
jgi:hypothetical protein